MTDSLRRQLLPAVALGLLMLTAAWWYFWLRPAQEANARLVEQIRADSDRIAMLQVELTRLRAADTALPMLPAAEVTQRWNAIVRALEADGLMVTRIEPGAPARPVPAPQPEPSPAASEDGQPEATPPVSPVALVRVGLTFAGDYGRLRAALALAEAAVPATVWTMLELAGQSGDGSITAKGDVQTLALAPAK
jgi:hypothetical protein